MKRITITICAAAFLLASCNNETKTAEETKSSGDTITKAEGMESTSYTMPDSATMMKNWQEYSTPSAMHAMMASWDGNWVSETRAFHAPGAPPEITKGSSSNKMIMGGRYLVSNHKGTMMEMPFEGMSTLAYDNAKKEFINTWIDNMGTGIMVISGPWNESTKTMTLTGKCVDPGAGGGREMGVREVYKVVDENTHSMEMYMEGPDGKEAKMMEIKFSRKK